MNQTARLQREKRIQEENARLLDRMQKSKPSYSVEKWLSDYDQAGRLIAYNGEYSEYNVIRG